MAEVITTVTIDTEEAENNLRSLTSEIELNKQNTKDMTKDLRELGDRTNENAQEYDFLSEQIAINKSEASELNRVRRRAIEETRAEEGSLRSLKIQLANNAAERESLNLTTEEGAEKAAELNAEMLDLTNAIKDQEESSGNFKRSVGEYPDGFDKVTASVTQLHPAVGGVTQGFGKLNGMLKTLMANPVLLVIGALALALQAIVTWMSRTEEGAEELAAQQAKLNVIWETFLDAVSAVGKYLFKVLVPLFKTLGEQASALTGTMGGLAKVFSGDVKEGFSQIGDSAVKYAKSFKNVGDAVEAAVDGFGEMSEEISKQTGLLKKNQEAAEAMAREEFKLGVATRENTVLSAQNRLSIAKNILASRDQTKSTEERLKAIDAATILEVENMTTKEDILRRELKIAKDRDAMFNSTQEDMQAVADAEAKLLDFQTQSVNKQRQLVNRRITLVNEQERAEKAASDAKKKRAEEDRIAKELEVLKLEGDEQKLQDFRALSLANEIEDEMARAEALAVIELEKMNRLLENEKFNEFERTLIIEESEARRVKIIEDANKKIESDKEKSAKAESARIEKEKKERNKALSVYLQASSNMYTLLTQYANEHSLGMKAIAIANATMNTYVGVTQALASAPPPASFALAATVLANGLAAVASIVKSSPSTSGSGGGGGSISGAQAAIDTTGGSSVDTSSADSQLSQEQALSAALASANLEVSVVEITNSQNEIEIAEQNSSIN